MSLPIEDLTPTTTPVSTPREKKCPDAPKKEKNVAVSRLPTEIVRYSQEELNEMISLNDVLLQFPFSDDLEK